MHKIKSQEQIRKEICNRWAALGLTDELQGFVNENVRKMLESVESETQELLKDSDEEPQFPIIVKMPPRIFNFNLPEENE